MSMIFICVCPCVSISHIFSLFCIYNQTSIDHKQKRKTTIEWALEATLTFKSILCFFHWSLLFRTREISSLLTCGGDVSKVSVHLMIFLHCCALFFFLRGMHCFWMALCFPQPAHRCIIHTSCVDELYSDIKYVSQPLGFTFTPSSMNQN